MISLAKLEDIPIIRKIAYETWPVAYGEILSAEQIQHMLSNFYSTDVLTSEIEKGLEILLYKAHEEYVGYAGFQINHQLPKTAHLHKLYVLPRMQGKFIGHQLLNDVMMRCKNAGCETLSLNVNRFNKAKTFYEKFGFKIIETVDIEIGNGYLMEDFMMQKVL